MIVVRSFHDMVIFLVTETTLNFQTSTEKNHEHVGEHLLEIQN